MDGAVWVLVRMVMMAVHMDGSVVAATAETKGEIKAVFAQKGRLGNQFGKGIIVMDGSIAHDYRSIAEIVEKEQVVINDDQGAGVVHQQFLEHLFLVRIEVGGGLVEDKYLRIHGHDGGKGRSFFLAVTEEMGRFVAKFGQSHRRQPLLHPFGYRLFVQALIHRTEGHVVIEGVAEQMIVRILKKHAAGKP